MALQLQGSDVRGTVCLDENMNFRFHGDFLMNCVSQSIVVDFGEGSEILIPRWTNQIGSRWFYMNRSLSGVLFDGECEVFSFGSWAFALCSRLSFICIPSSVTIICAGCFCACDNLSRLTFELGSKLSRIERNAFEQCASLSSIAIPSSIEIICECCFA
jgi:hypothetical protein